MGSWARPYGFRYDGGRLTRDPRSGNVEWPTRPTFGTDVLGIPAFNRGKNLIAGILGILEDKTKGNLSDDEKHLLDAALYETRMRYVSVSSQYIT